MRDHRLVLASASPRRRDLLDRLGLRFTVEPADVDETPRPSEEAADYVTRLSREKAVVRSREDAVVIGADTAVVLDGELLGKPGDRAEAASMLRRLGGRSHEVISGVCVMVEDADGRRVAAGAARSAVWVDALDAARVDWYVSTDEPFDKAGGYALQGAAALFADRVEGSVSNVIGLPMPLLDRLCHDLDIDLLGFRDRP